MQDSLCYRSSQHIEQKYEKMIFPSQKFVVVMHI